MSDQPEELLALRVEKLATVLAQVNGEPSPGRYERTQARAIINAYQEAEQ